MCLECFRKHLYVDWPIWWHPETWMAGLWMGRTSSGVTGHPWAERDAYMKLYCSCGAAPQAGQNTNSLFSNAHVSRGWTQTPFDWNKFQIFNLLTHVKHVVVAQITAIIFIWTKSWSPMFELLLSPLLDDTNNSIFEMYELEVRELTPWGCGWARPVPAMQKYGETDY